MDKPTEYKNLLQEQDDATWKILVYIAAARDMETDIINKAKLDDAFKEIERTRQELLRLTKDCNNLVKESRGSFIVGSL